MEEKKLVDELEKAKCIIKLLERDIEDLHKEREKRVEEVYADFMHDYKLMREECEDIYPTLGEYERLLAKAEKEIERLKKINEELYYSGLNENTARLGDMKKIEHLEDKVATLTEEVERLAKVNMENIGKIADLLEERENLQAELIATEDARLELKKQVDELTAFKNEAISMNLYEKGRKDGEEVANAMGYELRLVKKDGKAIF